jgi:hypothetical protein
MPAGAVPTGAADPGLEPSVSADADHGDDGRDDEVRCLACSHVATRRAEAIEVADAHARTFRNPAGWSFRVACYRRAPGCTLAGDATLEHTWFAGYAWRLLRCTGCQAHLGWWFTAADHAADDDGDDADAFAGLIATRVSG